MEKEGSRGITFRLPDDEWLKFKKFLLDRGLSAQEWLREQVKMAVEDNKKKGE